CALSTAMLFFCKQKAAYEFFTWLEFRRVLFRSAFGRRLFATGGNERAAELSGVKVRTVKMKVYIASGLCAAMAGLIIASELTSEIGRASCRQGMSSRVISRGA